MTREREGRKSLVKFLNLVMSSWGKSKLPHFRYSVERVLQSDCGIP
jgi:hypothetical protein